MAALPLPPSDKSVIDRSMVYSEEEIESLIEVWGMGDIDRCIQNLALRVVELDRGVSGG